VRQRRGGRILPSSAVFSRGVCPAHVPRYCRVARGSRAQRSIQRHIVIVLCFHRHSRFVPQKASLNNQLSARSRAIPGWRRPRCVGSAMSRRDRSGQAAESDRAAPSAHRKRSKANLSHPPTTPTPPHRRRGARASPPCVRRVRGGRLLHRSFVFIDILALFPKKHLSTIGFQLPAVPFPDGADPALWVRDVPKGQVRADGTICPPGPLGRAHARF